MLQNTPEEEIKFMMALDRVSSDGELIWEISTVVVLKRGSTMTFELGHVFFSLVSSVEHSETVDLNSPRLPDFKGRLLIQLKFALELDIDNIQSSVCMSLGGFGVQASIKIVVLHSSWC